MLTVDPTVGRAETLRRSMLSMITTGKDYEAHPAFWAPFVLVGEGARQIDFAHNVLAWWGNIMSLRNRIVLIGAIMAQAYASHAVAQTHQPSFEPGELLVGYDSRQGRDQALLQFNSRGIQMSLWAHRPADARSTARS